MLLKQDIVISSSTLDFAKAAFSPLLVFKKELCIFFVELEK